MERAPDFVVVGHVTKDLLAGGRFVVGGTATYASLTARNLGRQVGVVTSAEANLDLDEHLAGIQVSKRVSQATTTFQNVYSGGHRQQFVKALAEPLEASDVPAPWRDARVVLLGPLVRELGVDLVRLFPNALLGVTAQGWMRQWDGEGRVGTRVWEEAEEILPLVDVLVFSYEDVAHDLTLVRKYTSLAKITAVTHGRAGAIVCCDAGSEWLPAYQAREADPTGAGDVFAAAYLIALEETGDPFEAARFANCTASWSIEGEATSAIPTRDRVRTRLRRNELIDINGTRDDLILGICDLSWFGAPPQRRATR